MSGLRTVVSELKLPDGIGTVMKGSTGMRPDKLRQVDKGEILSYLKNDVEYFKYIPEYWDCEDMAYWGIACARCRCPGIPIGAALGRKLTGKKENHAVIVLWFEEGNKFETVYFDPTVKNVIKQKDFETWVAVPFPPYNPGAENGGLGVTPGFTKDDTIKNGALMLDVKYKIEMEKFGAVKNYLSSRKYERCNELLAKYIDTKDLKIVKRVKKILKAYRTPEDDAFWVFTRARREFRGYPIGVSFGTSKEKTTDGNSKAVLVLWSKSYEAPIYWDLHENGVTKDFTPRIVLV